MTPLDTSTLGPVRVEPDKRARNARLMRDVLNRLANSTTNHKTMTAALALMFADDADLDVVFRSVAI